jgi:hypothetical protein
MSAVGFGDALGSWALTCGHEGTRGNDLLDRRLEEVATIGQSRRPHLVSYCLRWTDTMNDRIRTDQTWIGQTDRTPIDRTSWHRWYACHPVICDNAPGGVVWGLTILRRRKRGRWVYRMGLRNRRL